MGELLANNNEYKEWVKEIKAKIRSAQIKAALSVNSEMILLYWDLGRSITEKQATKSWGSRYVDQLSIDLKSDFPELKGFSRRNLFYMRQFYQFYSSEEQIVQQVAAQIPWGHQQVILTKIKDLTQAQFYMQQCLENGWSRNVLALQIKSQLFERSGKSINNFTQALPKPNSDLAIETIKNPYVFDFLEVEKEAQEREIEKQLTHHITNFLLELGKGFAFVGSQFKLEVGEKEYFIDLLFYHYILECFVVIELKADEFKPEFAGKMNFYLSAVDDNLKKESDNPSIGIILCRTHNKIEAEYTLRDIQKPIGISEYRVHEAIPENLKSNLPTIEEIEAELSESLEEKE